MLRAKDGRYDVGSSTDGACGIRHTPCESKGKERNGA